MSYEIILESIYLAMEISDCFGHLLMDCTLLYFCDALCPFGGEPFLSQGIPEDTANADYNENEENEEKLTNSNQNQYLNKYYFLSP